MFFLRPLEQPILLGRIEIIYLWHCACVRVLWKCNSSPSPFRILVYVFSGEGIASFSVCERKKEKFLKRYLNLRRFLKGITVLFHFHIGISRCFGWARTLGILLFSDFAECWKFPYHLNPFPKLVEWKLILYLIYYLKREVNQALEWHFSFPFFLHAVH